jgi:CheY-like chemotaxis protein
MAQDSRLKEIPTIVLTGKSDAGTIRSCHDHCAYYVLKSPRIWDRIEPLLETLVPTERRAAPSEYLSPPCKETEEFTMNPEHRSARLDSILEALEEKVRRQVDQETPPGEAAPAPADAETPDNELPWILCIEDDQDFSRAMKMRLEARGIVVVRAFHGIDGYRLAFTHPAKAILLDYNLPGGQGDYVLRRLKENPLTADIPVIVITGRKDHSIARTMYNLGAAAYLTKPLIFDELLRELSKHIGLLPDAFLSLEDARQCAMIID